MKEFLKSIPEYLQSFGKWAWVLLIDFMLAGAQPVLDALGIIEIPSWIWQAQIVLTLILAPVISFHKVRLGRDRLRRRLAYRDWIKKVLSELAKTRAKGVALRNRGLTTTLKTRALGNWLADVKRWHKELEKQASEFGEHENSLLETLNLFVRMYAPSVTSRSQKQALDELNATLERLTELIVDFRPILWQAQPSPDW